MQLGRSDFFSICFLWKVQPMQPAPQPDSLIARRVKQLRSERATLDLPRSWWQVVCLLAVDLGHHTEGAPGRKEQAPYIWGGGECSKVAQSPSLLQRDPLRGLVYTFGRKQLAMIDLQIALLGLTPHPLAGFLPPHVLEFSDFFFLFASLIGVNWCLFLLRCISLNSSAAQCPSVHSQGFKCCFKPPKDAFDS